MYTKEAIGNGYWTVAHAMFESVSDPPTYEEQVAITDYLRASSRAYPCKVCRPGFSYVDENPPDFSSRKSLVVWGCKWHNSVHAHKGHPQKDCALVAETISFCPTCTIPAKQDKMRPMVLANDMVDAIVTEECKRYGVPKPKIVYDAKPKHCENTSCTMVTPDPKDSTIILNPMQASVRTVYHETYHYIASVLGPEKARKAFGPDYDGAMDNEVDAERYARGRVREMVPEGAVLIPTAQLVMADSVENINTVEPPQFQMSAETTPSGATEQALVTLPGTDSPTFVEQAYADGPSNFFDKLTWLYKWTPRFTGLTPEVSNVAYTPEILGTLLETGIDYQFTPLGSIWVNLFAGALLMGVGALGGKYIGYNDRVILKNWEAHHVTRVLTYLNPHNMQALSLQSRQIGTMFARGQGMQALRQYSFRDNGTVASGFRAIENTFRGLFAPAQAGAPPGSQMRATQFEQPSTSVSKIANFQ